MEIVYAASRNVGQSKITPCRHLVFSGSCPGEGGLGMAILGVLSTCFV